MSEDEREARVGEDHREGDLSADRADDRVEFARDDVRVLLEPHPLDLSRLLADRRREQGASFKLGAPIYLKGGELTPNAKKWMHKRFVANKKIRVRTDRVAAKGRCKRKKVGH